MARSMLSLGMEASLAFWTASPRAGLVSGSPPPSLAATVIARVSFVKSLPRRASTIAFLCLIPAHFECPAIGLSLSTDAVVQPFVGRSAALCREVLGARPAGVRIRAGDRALERRGQLSGVVAVERLAPPGAVVELPCRAHRRRPAGHRLDEHQAERLAPAGQRR